MDCKNCGAPLAKRAEYCTNCGTPVKDFQKKQGGATGGVAAANNRRSTVVIGILGIIALIAILVAVVSLHDMGVTSSRVASTIEPIPNVEKKSNSEDPSPYDSSSRSSLLADEESDEIAEAPVVMMPGAGGSQASSDSPEGDDGDNDGGADEEEVHDILKAYYEEAGVYDKYVEQCADDFNNHYLDKSKSQRQELADSAEYLEADINELWKSISALEVPSSSGDYKTWQDVCTLYECLWHRIDVIAKSWNISLSYDDPRGHEEDILEPIRADNVDGDNKYYTQFKELYPTIKL